MMEGVISDGVTPTPVLGLRERLTEHLRLSLLPEVDSANPAATFERIPLIRWINRANHNRGARSGCRSATLQTLHLLLEAHRYGEFRDMLARAEIAGEISEFYALNLHAILAVAEGSDFASEYLQMAEAVATTSYEIAIVAENLAAYELSKGDSFAAAERCLAALDHVCQTEGLWITLLIALYHLGEMETIDATLGCLTQLDDECTARLVRSLSSEPELHDVRARPAFQQLMDSRAATGLR